MMNSRDDVGFSSVSWIRQGLLELDRLKDSPFQNLIWCKLMVSMVLFERKDLGEEV